jgi:hypothetical protein
VKWPHLTAMPQVTLLNEITEGEALVIWLHRQFILWAMSVLKTKEQSIWYVNFKHSTVTVHYNSGNKYALPGSQVRMSFLLHNPFTTNQTSAASIDILPCKVWNFVTFINRFIHSNHSVQNVSFFSGLPIIKPRSL